MSPIRGFFAGIDNIVLKEGDPTYVCREGATLCLPSIYGDVYLAHQTGIRILTTTPVKLAYIHNDEVVIYTRFNETGFGIHLIRCVLEDAPNKDGILNVLKKVQIHHLFNGIELMLIESSKAMQQHPESAVSA